jgi:hypothetical protein
MGRFVAILFLKIVCVEGVAIRSFADLEVGEIPDGEIVNLEARWEPLILAHLR